VWQLGYTFAFFQHRHRVVDLSLYGFGLAASGVTSYGYNLTRNRGEAAGPGWANLLPGPLSLKDYREVEK